MTTVSIHELESMMGDHWNWLPPNYWQAYLDFINQPGDRVCLKALSANVVASYVRQSEKDTENSLKELKDRKGTGLWNYLKGQLNHEVGRVDDAETCFEHALKSGVDQKLKPIVAGALERIKLEGSFDTISFDIDSFESRHDDLAAALPACVFDKAQPLFEIVVSGLRLFDSHEKCVRSIGEQTYRNFRVHLLSDDDPVGSTLDPLLFKERYHLASIPVVKTSPIRVGKAALIYDHLQDFDFEPNSIVLILDGDDRFAVKTALSQFANVYSSEKPDACWSTYVRSDGVLGHSAPLIRGIHHRKQGWRSSHCFTFRAELIKQVPRSYILDAFGKPVMQACDLALALPILDLAERTFFIPEVLYHYTVDNPESHHNQSDGTGLTSKRQMETGRYLYSKQPLHAAGYNN